MDLTNLIKETLKKQLDKSLVLKNRAVVSESLQYHMDNEFTLTENIFKTYSDGYFDLVNEVRELYEDGSIKLNKDDTVIVESDLGKKVMLKGNLVYLDAPFICEDEKYQGKDVELNKPIRTSEDTKKFAVYVKSKTGEVKKITFGSPNTKISSELFRKTHNCDQKTDKTTVGYWRCNLGKFSKQLGLGSSNSK